MTRPSGRALIGIFLGLALLPFVVLFFYAHPAADDFCFAYRFPAMSFGEYMVHWYTGWSGRYATFAAHPLMYQSLEPVIYRFFLILLFAFLGFGLYWIVRALTGGQVSRRNALLAALFGLVVYLHQMPGVAAAFYWLSGTISYQLGNAFALVGFAAAIQATRTRERQARTALGAVAALSLLGAVGTNEVAMLFVLGTLATAAAVALWTGSRTRRLWLGLTAAAVMGAVVWALSPGNRARLTEVHSGATPDLATAGVRAAAEVARYIPEWGMSAPLLLSTLLFLPAAVWLARRVEALREHLFVHPVLPVLVSGGLIALAFFLPHYGAGGVPPRTANVVFLFFLIAWFLNVQILVGYLLKRGVLSASLVPGHSVAIAAAALLVFSLFAEGNVRQAYADLLLLRARDYDQENRARGALVQQALGEGRSAVTLPLLRSRPESLFFDDISLDSTDWRNTCYADYLRIEEVHAAE